MNGHKVTAVIKNLFLILFCGVILLLDGCQSASRTVSSEIEKIFHKNALRLFQEIF